MSPRAIHQTRKAARRKAVQILYQASVTGRLPADIIAEGLYVDEVGVPCEFTKLLLSGTVEHVDEIDDLIACASENWSIDRMPIVDLSVLRMAIFEMKYLDDVPLSVSINEAVDLAKHYGGEDDSSRFVNGVLGKIAVMLEQDGLSASDVLKAPETSAHDTEDTQDRPDIQEALPESQELQETAPPEQEN